MNSILNFNKETIKKKKAFDLSLNLIIKKKLFLSKNKTKIERNYF